MKQKRNMWQMPWGYRESTAIVAGVAFVGLMLQLVAGPFDYGLLRWPVNAVLGAVILFVCWLPVHRKQSGAVRWVSGVPMSVTLICALVILGLIMGLTPQQTGGGHHQTGFIHSLGFTAMTSSWAFVLVYLMTLLSLGMLVFRRLRPFRMKHYAFYLNHIGLWLLLFAGGLGAADIRRYVMHVREGEVEWRVYNDRGDILDLPVAIELEDFRMEEYPPQLAVIDRESGAVQPESAPVYWQIDERQPGGTIGPWELRLVEYIHEAVRNSDSTYREALMPGASPAALVQALNRETGDLSRGWVCSGNISQLYMVLNLSEQYSLVMTRPEPKRYVSDIKVFTESGKYKEGELEVNKPMKIGHWMLYQYGYDNEAGKLSTYSSIELVYDPWVVPVYVGIALLGAGSVCMLLWAGNRRKEDKV